MPRAQRFNEICARVTSNPEVVDLTQEPDPANSHGVVNRAVTRYLHHFVLTCVIKAANSSYFVQLQRLIPKEFLCFQRRHCFDSDPRLQFVLAVT
jgi:hypothetical protein